MTPGADPRGDRVKKQGTAWLAGAGLWVALGAAEALAPGPAVWVRVTFACCMGLTALSFIAVYRRRSGRAGHGLSVRARGEDDGPDGAAMHQWRALTMVSRLMPASAGRRWLAEAESVLTETAAARRAAAIRSYLRSAPRLAVMMWTRRVLRRRRIGPRRPG
jgi:hypothetical protein